MLNLQSLSFSIGSYKLLDQIDLSLMKNEIYCLTGPNGAGKTTLFNLISGFLKPSGGSILFHGHPISSFQPYRRANLGISRTFQDIRLINSLTVRENIILASSPINTSNLISHIFHHQKRNAIDGYFSPRTNQIIAELNIANLLDLDVSELSIGQQKLVSLACAFSKDSELVLLDEPLAALDLQVKETILEFLLNNRDHRCIAIIDHDYQYLSTLITQYLFLLNGQIYSYDTLHDFLDDDNVSFTYL